MKVTKVTDAPKPALAPTLPTPTELVNVAIALRPAKMTSGAKDQSEDAIAEALGVWMLARNILDQNGMTSGDMIRDEAKKADAALSGTANRKEQPDDYSISEAVREFGNKGTRGERSFFELIKAAQVAGALSNIALTGGLESWVRDTGRIDAPALSILKQFKSKRLSERGRKGGLGKAAKKAVK